MPVPTCFNARADECSITETEWGQRIVRYSGEEFVLIGLYFGCNGGDHRELYYILRMSPAYTQNGARNGVGRLG